MNYLAHFYLSDQTSEGFTGSIMGDFVRGNFVGKYTPIIEREIEIHRKIDVFTDTNSIVKRSKQRVSKSRGKFAGVLVDMFYDHFLAVNFESHTNISLEEFSQKVYQSINHSQKFLPLELHEKIVWIAKYDLLSSYTKIEGIGRALYGISKRIKRKNNLPEGIFDLKNNYHELQKDFTEFFPQLVEFVESERNFLTQKQPN
jgi:acyl carrier protein phosphodiesterase